MQNFVDMFATKSKPYDFAAKWRELHCMLEPTMEKLLAFAASLPSFGCGCKDHFAKLLKDMPPRFDDWRRWTFEAHNAVNERLGKKRFTWEQFESKYPEWKQVDGLRIGVVSVNYESLGGTETFHQTLVPRLPNVIGFASLHDLQGDTNSLEVPTGQGVDAIASLAIQCDVVVSWNIDWGTLPRPKRVIAVHHGSVEDEWGMRLCLHGDTIVCVNEDVAKHVRSITTKSVHCIEPCVDESRIKPRQAVQTNGKKICLWSHRFAADKQPQLAIEIAKHLPPDWHMVLTGHRGEKLEVSDRVTILPPQHPGDWLAVVDCFLSTSLFEGFGLSVAEAITAGVPVVSSPVGIATRPGLASIVPIDAAPEEWAKAIVASVERESPSRDLFGVEAFLTAWESVILSSANPSPTRTLSHLQSTQQLHTIPT
jgi:glycosyltransferase involved in cell wall biosynthesis